MGVADPLPGLLRRILTARIGDSQKPERVDADYLVHMWREIDAGEDRIAWLLERLLPKCDGFAGLTGGWSCSLEGTGPGLRILWRGPDGIRGEAGINKMAAAIRSLMILDPAPEHPKPGNQPPGLQMSLF